MWYVIADDNILYVLQAMINMHIDSSLHSHESWLARVSKPIKRSLEAVNRPVSNTLFKSSSVQLSSTYPNGVQVTLMTTRRINPWIFCWLTNQPHLWLLLNLRDCLRWLNRDYLQLYHQSNGYMQTTINFSFVCTYSIYKFPLKL